MQAATQHHYGSPEVLHLDEVPAPTCGPHEILIRVHASPVTYGDRRLRSADFPSFTWIPGRLMFGILRPRNPVPGTMFAGRVEAIGANVTSFSVGDDVFGSADHGAYAELLVVPEQGAVAKLPVGFHYDEAAAVPYGAVTALVFLRDLANVRSGERVLIVGAAGGVGRMAVQVAKHLGAQVTGVCSADSFELVRSLGADQVIDYATEDFTENGIQYDVIFDTSATCSFGRSRRSLAPQGRLLFLEVTVGVLAQSLFTPLFRGRTVRFTVALGNRALLETVRGLMEDGVLRPVVDRRFPLERIVEAHEYAEHGRPRGTVVVTVNPGMPLQAVAK